MTYNVPDTAADWYRSPVGMNPISVLPENTREEYIERLTEDNEELTPVEAEMDPFSREVFEYLKREYSEDGVDNLFEKITDEQHFRVVRRTMEQSDGIGILHAEDGGSEKERLVGSWMPEMLKEFQSRGRKNPQAFTYDGALSQGFGGVTIVEDARQHIGIIQKLLNIPEENSVKLDKQMRMDVDTVLILVSNPDLEAEINQHSSEGQKDPFRALRRRMSRYDLRYLTRLSLEANLLHRLLMDSDELWHDGDSWEEIRKPVEVYGCRFEPHSIEIAALYDVVTRVDSGRLDDLSEIEKALAFERGYHDEGAERTDVKSLNIKSEHEGKDGMPVTHTMDSLVNVAQNNEYAMADDVIEAMKENISEAPVFSKNEATHHQKHAIDVESYAVDKYEEDTIDAMLMDVRVTEEEIEEYVDGLIAWQDGEEDDYDPYELKDFEVENFAALKSDYTSGAEPSDEVKQLRENEIINPVSNAYYESADGGEFDPEDVALEEIPTFEILLNSSKWRDVERHYENADFSQWESPPTDTETEELKDKTVENMTEMGYSETGAEKASSIAIRRGVV
jgi:predicted Ser/Thr protein kinase